MQAEKSFSAEIVDPNGQPKLLKDIKFEFVKIPTSVVARRQEVVLAYDKQIFQETTDIIKSYDSQIYISLSLSCVCSRSCI